MMQPAESATDTCPLCGRPLAEPSNRHHLLPLSKGGKGTTTVLMHKVCHDKIHAVLTEMELKRYYHTIERLQQQEDIARFIKWVQNKPPQFYDRSVKKKR
jgi:hypothetical protein